MQARFTSGLLHYSYSLTKQTQRSRKGERVCCSGDGERQEEGETERLCKLGATGLECFVVLSVSFTLLSFIIM